MQRPALLRCRQANANTSTAIAGCTCKLCANDAILVAVTPLYTSFVGGADDVGATTTSATGVAVVDNDALQMMTVAANGGPHPHLHRVMTARQG